MDTKYVAAPSGVAVASASTTGAGSSASGSGTTGGGGGGGGGVSGSKAVGKEKDKSDETTGPVSAQQRLEMQLNKDVVCPSPPLHNITNYTTSLISC